MSTQHVITILASLLLLGMSLTESGRQVRGWEGERQQEPDKSTAGDEGSAESVEDSSSGTQAVEQGSAAPDQAPQQVRRFRVQRARRPEFSEREWEGVFFEDLFSEALRGKRPTPADTQRSVASDPAAEPPSDEPREMEGMLPWRELVSATVLENEVKRIQRGLAEEITVPARFSSDYQQAKMSFYRLSMIFAVIFEYEEDTIRWRRNALDAQAAFFKAASFPSNKIKEAYEFSRIRRDYLDDMVLGSDFPDEESAEDSIQWDDVVQRSAMMERLEAMLYDRLEPWASSPSEFSNNRDELVHEAELVAMMGRILATEGMDDTEDEGYRELSLAMMQAAHEAANAAEQDEYQTATEAINRLGQTCTNCHDEWR